jgi:hypothetical protein
MGMRSSIGENKGEQFLRGNKTQRQVTAKRVGRELEKRKKGHTRKGERNG